MKKKGNEEEERGTALFITNGKSLKYTCVTVIVINIIMST